MSRPGRLTEATLPLGLAYYRYSTYPVRRAVSRNEATLARRTPDFSLEGPIQENRILPANLQCQLARALENKVRLPLRSWRRATTVEAFPARSWCDVCLSESTTVVHLPSFLPWTDVCTPTPRKLITSRNANNTEEPLDVQTPH